MKKSNNVTLIGMPGSGKTTLGKLLAKKLNFKFIDGDEYIIKKEKMNLQEIIDNKGDKFFIRIEEKRILELLPLRKSVFAPGGSIIYSKKLIPALKKSSLVVFLDTPLAIIEKRLTGKASRGIVGLGSKTIKELYKERAPFYKKYADIVVNCSKQSNHEIVEKIIKNLK